MATPSGTTTAMAAHKSLSWAGVNFASGKSCRDAISCTMVSSKAAAAGSTVAQVRKIVRCCLTRSTITRGGMRMRLSDARRFLQTAGVTGAGLALGAGASPAIEPIRRTGKSQIRLSLAAYSYRRYLDLKAMGKPAMTLDDFIDA